MNEFPERKELPMKMELRKVDFTKEGKFVHSMFNILVGMTRRGDVS